MNRSVKISRFTGKDKPDCEDCVSNGNEPTNLAQWVIYDREECLYLCHEHKQIYEQELFVDWALGK